jgi:glycerophosphoryl diester phosphodiesterase
MRMIEHIMRKLLLALPFLAAACVTTADANWPAPTLNHAKPLLIAHRGASGLRPEHTIAGYKLAIQQGADCIEPDLVMTKDGVLVDRHDTFLSTTTDVATRPEFANRKRKSPDPEFAAQGREDWWVADFTLAELKQLRAIQSFRGRSKEFDGQFDIPTFAEVLALAKASKTTTGKPVCVYPEAKSPAYHASLGHEMAGPILTDLKKYGMDVKGSPIFIQSFEPPFVKQIQPMTELPVIMLVGDKSALDSAMKYPGAPFWDGLGPGIQMLFNADGSSSGVVEDAHKRGIAVHPWTFRDDARMNAPPFNGEPIEESEKRVLNLGVDGFFTDFPGTGRKVIDAYTG